jgi:hypothetical protein
VTIKVVVVSRSDMHLVAVYLSCKSYNVLEFIHTKAKNSMIELKA